MLRSKSLNHPFHDRVRSILVVGNLLLILSLAGCGGASPSAPTTPQPSPQTYFAPTVVGAPAPGATTFSFDETTAQFSFSQTTYSPKTQPGPQILNAGTVTVAQRGLRSLSISTTYVWTPSNPIYVPTTPTTSGGSFAVELAGQAGGLVQLVGQPVMPLVAATECPNFSSAQTYQFITIPGSLLPAGTPPVPPNWDPTAETAYGSVDISSNGSTVNFQNIKQFTLPSVGGKGTPTQPPLSSPTGTCASTYFGNTIAVPGQATITTPGVGGSGNNVASAQATIGIGSSGLMVEDSGGTDNFLGASTGAVGLPKPSTALDTGAVVGAQYLGFVYGTGAYTGTNAAGNWSSHLASFGFSTVPSACASVAANTATLIYGGDFTNDDPSTYPNGFGNCDLAIDLGEQDTSNNGLYPNAKVWLGASYQANITGTTYLFSAVAIVGQLNGKNAIFVLGVDSTQPWSIYLLQSN